MNHNIFIPQTDVKGLGESAKPSQSLERKTSSPRVLILPAVIMKTLKGSQFINKDLDVILPLPGCSIELTIELRNNCFCWLRNQIMFISPMQNFSQIILNSWIPRRRADHIPCFPYNGSQLEIMPRNQCEQLQSHDITYHSNEHFSILKKTTWSLTVIVTYNPKNPFFRARHF